MKNKFSMFMLVAPGEFLKGFDIDYTDYKHYGK